MLLVVDVGNTQTVVGAYCQSELVSMWRVATNRIDTSDELRAKLLSLLEARGLSLADVSAVSLASVVPQLTESWREAVYDGAGVEAVVCTAESAGSLFRQRYVNLQELGADRVADAVAAVALYGAPVVVIDFGTATNIEVIDRDGCFIGGIIAPGVQTSAQALFSHASRLATIDLIAPDVPIGESTETAVQSGIVFGEADRVDGLVRRIFAQLGYGATVVATGGLVSLVAEHSSVIQYVNPELTIEGLRLLAEANESMGLEH